MIDFKIAGRRYHWEKRGLSRFCTDYIVPYIGDTLLDIGCGPSCCQNDFIEKKLYKDVVAFDIEEEFLISKTQKCVQGNAERLPFADGSFDTVLLIDVLEHCEDDVSALNEAYRVTRQNLLITVPNHDEILRRYKLIYAPWIDRTHFRAYTSQQFNGILINSGYDKYRIMGINKVGFFSLILAFLDRKKGMISRLMKYFFLILDRITQRLSPFYITLFIVIEKE